MSPIPWAWIPLVLWLCHVLAAGVLVVPVVYFSRKRVRWYWWECLALLLPFLLWAFLIFFASIGPKSVSNMCIEPLILGGTLGIVSILRAAIGARWPGPRLAAITLLGLCLAAVAMLLLVPALPE
ncbi:MAG: hypothetical protein WCO60_13905 [Verrucomicrobiota bacterium]